MSIATNIVPPRVPFLDDRTGLISREWYQFFLSLFVLTGAGQSDATITDLAVTPDVSSVGSNVAALASLIDQTAFGAPRVDVGTLGVQNADRVTISGGQIANAGIAGSAITSSTVSGSAITGSTTLGKRSTGSGAFDLDIANTENLTADRTLNIKLNDANRALDLGANFAYTEGTWTPVFTGLTVVLGAGSVAYAGTYTRIGRVVQFVATITPSGGATTAAVAGTTFHTLPIASGSSSAGSSSAVNGSTLASYGNGIPSTSVDYVPTWPAVASQITIAGTYYI